MINKSIIASIWLIIFSCNVIAEEVAAEKAAENTQSAEDELSKLEQTVGEDADSSAPQENDQAATNETEEDKASSKPWLPAAKKFDWIQLTSGEWLKGEIKSMYNDSLEFDSDKLGLLSIDWSDVKYLKSYRPSSINIENHLPVTGNLQISDDTVSIGSGDNIQTFDRVNLVSLTPSAERESDLWAIKLTLGLNIKSGNTEQLDYTSKLDVKRRTAKTRFLLDYIGNISKTGGADEKLTETVNNHRITSSYNIYATRYLFYQPIFAEYYRDPFQNIDHRITAGVGLGYTIFDTGLYEWNVTGGPAYVSTKFVSVQPGEDKRIDAAALVFGTVFDAALTDSLDFNFKYNITAMKEESGGYTHHMIATFENEITDNLDFDISLIWDRISQPITGDDGVTPEPDDYRIMIGISYTY